MHNKLAVKPLAAAVSAATLAQSGSVEDRLRAKLAAIANAKNAEPHDPVTDHLSPDQVVAFCNFADLVFDHDLQIADMRLARAVAMQQVFAKPAPWDVWKPFIRVVRDESEYLAKATRAAYKDVHGELPTAGKGSGKGRKGVSPTRTLNKLDRGIADAIEDIKGMKRDILTQDVRRIIGALNALHLAYKSALANIANEA